MNNQPLSLHERLIDILVMSPMSDIAGTSMTPIERTAEQIIAALGLTGEWGVAVEALGDLLPGAPGPEACLTEEAARDRIKNSSRKWTHDNPVSLHRRVVGAWERIDPSDSSNDEASRVEETKAHEMPKAAQR
jgi:hypothetical protein